MFFYYVEGIAVLACVALALWIGWIAFLRIKNKRIVMIRNISAPNKEIEDFAKENAGEHTVSGRKHPFNWPIPRMNANYEFILSTYKELNENIRKKLIVPDTAEWLLDNFYIIEEQVKVMRRDSDRKFFLKLPVLKSGPYKGFSRIFAIAMDLVAYSDGQIDDAVLAGYLNAYQTKCPLYDREISALSTVAQLALLERIRSLCKNIRETLSQWQKADKLVNDALKSNAADWDKHIRQYIRAAEDINPRFVEHLFYRLRRSKRSFTGIQRAVDERLAKTGTDLMQLIQQEHSAQSKDTVTMGNCITSLRYLTSMDWTTLLEATSFVDEILREDPDGTYPGMDAPTRGRYRSRVEKLAAVYGVSEYQIAMEAVTLAREARLHSGQNRFENEIMRTWHIGYYLLGGGLKDLCRRVRSEGAEGPECLHAGNTHSGLLYFGSIGLLALLLIWTAVWYGIIATPFHALLPTVLAGIAVLLPSLEIAISTVNFIACKLTKPAMFPKMDFKDGIPDTMRTFVVVPTLLSDEKTVVENFKNLEGQYLRNREKNLLFAVIGAYRDSNNDPNTGNEGIIRSALETVAALNGKYAKDGKDIFYFFHRKSLYNQSNNKWFGWERKRGALLEFNDLLLGSDPTSFVSSSCSNPESLHIAYIITLDGDTILPFGMAKKMVETMAHPLNKPVVDKNRGVVTQGYAILQPRVFVSCESSSRTLFSRAFAGHEGLDPYANAISDVYQDTFGEGIYTGKGIYDLRVFQSLLRDAFPENAILSHDLLEGSYARTGLVTDLKLIDSFPMQYNSFAARQHRWVRGDWQLLPFVSGTIHNRSHRRISNPLNALSRWKIIDNMRRSLLPPALMLLFLLSITILPGNLFFWLGAIAFTICFPFLIALIEYVSSQRYASDRIKRHIPVIVGVKAALLQSFFTFVLLPYQAASMLDAILITLGRVLFTKRNMLEWVTMADVEKTQKNSPQSYWIKMIASPSLALFAIALAMILKPAAVLVCLFVSFFWVLAPQIAFLMSQKREEPTLALSDNDKQELRKLARRTYRYFEEFANARNHFLPPDNYQADPPRGIAYRTSPTNIGLGLMAVLTGRDFGYIGTGKMAESIRNILITLESLEKWNGHLLNWYDTRTLTPLRPRYVSTVDSGNFISYLVTLKRALGDFLTLPLFDRNLAEGLADTLLCAGKEGESVLLACDALNRLKKEEQFDPNLWNKALEDLIKRLGGRKDSVYFEKAERMATGFKCELELYMPWIGLLDNASVDRTLQDLQPDVALKWDALTDLLRKNTPLGDMPKAIAKMQSLVCELIRPYQDQREAAWLCSLQQVLNCADAAAKDLLDTLTDLQKRIDDFCTASFAPLYSKQKKLFSIGYNLEDGKLTNSYYDLLASEARQTSYLAIARGDIESEHWSRMGRALTTVDGYKGLISWTGTMFEYLMPLLIMKNYENTLLDETYSFVVRSQRRYAKQKGAPWGMSESAFNLLDINHDFQYKAFGIPWLGLKRGLSEDVVVSPYSTFLALLVDPVEAVKNIDQLLVEGLGGSYGLYEAADYSPQRLPFDNRRAVVKSYMAHHHGMSLMALNNTLHQNILQRRFHDEPEIHAARLLLQEKIPSKLLFTKETREKVVPFMGPVQKESPQRRYDHSDPLLPMAHILSNGSYSVMLTDRGTGYSRTKMAAVNRWRADSTLDPYGMYLYVQNRSEGCLWSSAYAPLNVMPDAYEVLFGADKAVFRRRDGAVETETEITVADADNAEIRRVSLKNTGSATCELEVTSYFEVVLNTQSADIAHPAFGNLFVQTEYLPEKKCLIANRRTRSEQDRGLWLATVLVTEGKAGSIQYESDRMQFLGRGHTAKSPIVFERGRQLSNTTGPVLDPVMSLRAKLTVDPSKTARVSFVVCVAESREDLLALVDKYAGAEDIEKAFQLSLTRSRVEAGFLNLQANESELYQELIRELLFISPDRKRRREWILKNTKSQPSLWRFGISGDHPIVMAEIKNADKAEILYEILKAHEYWRLLDMRVDLVVLCDEEYSYSQPLFSRIREIVLIHSHGAAMPKDVFILDRSKLNPEEYSLLHEAAAFTLVGDSRSLAEQVRREQPEPLPKYKQTAIEEEVCYPTAICERALLFENGLGGFNTDGSEYVIQLDPGHNTPAPWVNVVANSEFGFIASESGSSFAWAYNSHQAKLTPWNNDIVSDPPAEVIYLCDNDDGAIWTATPQPVREEGRYTIRHGFGYTAYEHTSRGIDQELVEFVPIKGTIKISLMHLKNTSDKKRNLSLTYYVQPVLGISSQFTAGHIQTQICENGMLLIRNRYSEMLANKVCFVDCSEQARTCTGDRKEFFGSGGLESPDCLQREMLSNNVGTGYDPCAAMQVNIALEPGECKDVVFLLGTADESEDINAIASRFGDAASALRCLEDVRCFWQNTLGAVHVQTPNTAFDLMQNGWLQYQVISCRLWARSGFYQSGGAYGFRDQLQDCLSVLYSRPDMTKEQILLHARHQFKEGDVLHWWHEPSGKGTRTKFSDDRLWLPYAVAEYIHVTGDAAILNETIPFLEDEPLKVEEDERYTSPAVTYQTAALYEHCLRAIDVSLQFGAHGLPLMGSGDWNDGMSSVGKAGGESVWLGWFLLNVLDGMIPFCIARGDTDKAAGYKRVWEALKESIELYAWDGNWYKRAFFGGGTPLGSAVNDECRIDSISQSWAVISGSGKTEREVKAMQSLEDLLVCWEDGIIKLLAPPFDKGDLEPGYIKGYVPGVRENGGQYTHAAAWAIMAFAKLGFGDKAFMLYDLINPINHTATYRDCAKYRVEPYVMAADVYAFPPHAGKGGWTWYTGSAGWMYRAGLEHILGFKKIGDTLFVDPCIPEKWREYSIQYRHQNTDYCIKVANPEGVNRGVRTVCIDGIETADHLILLANDGKAHNVLVIMGCK